jgi:hypothetical protein
MEAAHPNRMAPSKNRQEEFLDEETWRIFSGAAVNSRCMRGLRKTCRDIIGCGVSVGCRLRITVY